MSELKPSEQLQIDLSFSFASEIVMPVLNHCEDMLERIAGDGEFIGSPHFDTLMLCVREMVERGWTADELVEQVRYHAEQQEEMRDKRVVN